MPFIGDAPFFMYLIFLFRKMDFGRNCVHIDRMFYDMEVPPLKVGDDMVMHKPNRQLFLKACFFLCDKVILSLPN